MCKKLKLSAESWNQLNFRLRWVEGLSVEYSTTFLCIFFSVRMKKVQTDVSHKPCNHKAILIHSPGILTNTPVEIKETRRNKNQIAKCKILDWQSKHQKCLEAKAKALFIKWRKQCDWSVAEIKIYFKTFFLCLYFSRLRIWKANTRRTYPT